ncbi:MAG: glycosyl hydrolase family 88 [Enterococcus sp.]|nr:glycosyl hydrolase family 88 [Enterococcus sp.]
MEKIKVFFDDLLNQSTPDKPVWNQEAILENKPPAWSYIDGCMLIAVLEMYQSTKEEKYFEFLKSFIDFYVNEKGEILGYSLDAMNSDSINEGKVLFVLYEQTKDERYKKAMDCLYAQIKKQPRTPSGSFWHKKIYPNQIWLDGLYMVQPFYLEYERNFNANQNLPDIMQQFYNVSQKMKDPKTGLYYHGYDETRKAFWANSDTGCSENFWTRSLGWYAMALIDTISLLKDDYPKEKETLVIDLTALLEALFVYEEADSKLFYQVTNQGAKEGNYLETSGSSAIAYTLMKGARLGVLPENFYYKGEEILKNIVAQKLVCHDGKYRLKDICLVAGLGGMPGKGHYKQRDGSYEYYISEPIVENDAKGIGPLVYAYTEYLKSQN